MRLERRTNGGRLLAIYFWVVVAYLLLPILIVVPTSFSAQEFLRFPPTKFGLRWYSEYLSSPGWLDATFRSLRIAFCASAVTTLCGSLAALALERGGIAMRSALTALFAAPAIVPHVILALGIFIVAVWIGAIGMEVVLILAHAALSLPFAVLIVSAALRQVDPTLERAARVLGAGPIKSFCAATLPSLVPSIVATAIFAFFISFDELIVALFLMGDKETLPVRIWTDLRFELSPTIAPISTLMVIVTTLAMIAAELLRRRAPNPKSTSEHQLEHQHAAHLR